MRSVWVDVLAEGRASRLALICLGVWLNAADSLVSATIMPTVAAQLGGYAYFSWATAGFLVGAIVAGASAGRLSERYGLRAAIAFSGLVFTFGCIVSAMAPGIVVFLSGRLVQGIGSGWIAGFAMVAVAASFPHQHLPRVFACVSGVWGIATVLGPLVGGLFAQHHNWRGVFWLFAAQGGAFSAVAFALLKGPPTNSTQGIPWRQLAVLGAGICAFAAADLYHAPLTSALLLLAGFAALKLVLQIDARASTRLLPHRAGQVTSVCGAAYASMFALTAASMGFLVYMPAILQVTRGLSPLWAGYVVGAEALAWTLAAFVVSGTSLRTENGWIRVGAICIVAAMALLTVVTHSADLPLIVAGAVLLGAGFGFSSSLMNRRVITSLGPAERAIGSSALIAVRQTGGAIGAAIAGVAANLAGLASGATPATAQAASVWVFAAGVPLALGGLWAAVLLTRPRAATLAPSAR
ncbi:MAG TPA: MFS transporter [Steroidobacteraceae bacterium]|jgi:MFS family permease|nr:MFS transporter [Steroidobacteraceae bacterium]